MNWLPYLELMSHRPGAMKYTTFYNNLSDNWRKYLNSQDTEGKRKGLTSLYTMVQKHDMGIAETALEFAISNGVQDADSILAAYRTLTAPTQQMQPMQLNCNVVQMPAFQPDNQKYDAFLSRKTHVV